MGMRKKGKEKRENCVGEGWTRLLFLVLMLLGLWMLEKEVTEILL